MPILVFPAPGSETAQQNLDRFSCFDIDFSPSGKNSNILRWSENFNNSQWRKQNNQITFTESFNFLDSYLYDTDGLISPLSVATKPSNDYSVLYIRSNAIALSQTVLVEPDTAYTLSFVTGGEFNSNLKIRIFCNSTQSNIVATNVAVTTTNTRIQQSFVTSSSCYSVDFFLVDYGTEPQTVFITQPQLQTGNVFTEFYPTYDLGIFQQSAVSKPSRGSLSFFVDNLYNWDPIASVTGSNLFGYSTIDSYINDDDLFIANIASTTSTKILYHNSLTRPYLPTRTVRLQNQNQTLGQYTVVASQNDSITIETSDNLAFTDGMTIIPTYGDLTTENRLRYLYSNDLLRNYNSLNRFFLEAYYPVRLFDRIKFNLYERIGQPSNFRPPNFAANVKLTQDYRVVSDKLQITARHNISGQSSLIDATLFRRGAINAQIWRNFVGLENRLTERMYVPQVRLFFDSFRVARDFTKIKFLENRIQDVSLSRLFKSFSRVNPIRINSMPVRNTILNNLYYKFIGVEPKTIIRSSNIISTTQSFTSENISSIISTPPSSSTAVTQLLISNLLNFLLPAGNLNVNIAAVTTRSTPENIAVYSNVALGQPAQVVGTDIFINNILDSYLFDSDILTYSTAQKSTQTFSIGTELEEPMPVAYFDGRNSLVETEPTSYFTVPSGSIEMNIMPDITRNNQVILSVYRNELVEFLRLDDVLIQPSGGVITEYIGDYAVFVFSVNSTFFIKPNQNYKNFYDAEVLLVGGGGGGGGNFTGANGGGGGGAVVHMTRVPISPNVLYSIKIGAGGTGGSGTAGGNGETTEAFGAIAAGGGGGGTYPTGNGIGGAVSSSGGAGANDVGGTLNTSANTFDTISKLAPLSTGVIYTGQVGGSLTGVRTGTTTRGAGGGGAGGSAQNTNPNLAGSAIGYGTAGSGGPGASINILNRICYFGGGGGGGGYLTTAGNGGFGGGGGGGAYATGSGVFNGFNGYGSYLDTTILNLDPAGASRSGLSLGNAGTAMSGGGGGGGGGGGVGGGAGGNGCVMVKIQYRKNNVYDILLTSSLLSAITTTYPITLEILMVGGGGAGNGVYLGGGGGGGGAGGVLYTSGISVLSNTSYDITIGGGGAAAPNGSIAGASGGSTSINLGGTVYTAQGGGRHDSPGGSGGGRSNDYGGPFAATQNSPAPFNGYGSNGGDGSRGPGGSSAGGGGGGAGGVGASTVYIGTGIGGNGGIGIANNITGTLTYYAGGGGGGSEGPQQGTGGTGGGGRGGSANTGISPDSGLPNTGGGGGGFGGPGGVGGTIGAGGSGGSGVMIFRMSNNYSAQFSTGLLSSLNTNIAGYSIYTVTGGTGTVRFV